MNVRPMQRKYPIHPASLFKIILLGIDSQFQFLQCYQLVFSVNVITISIQFFFRTLNHIHQFYVMVHRVVNR